MGNEIEPLCRLYRVIQEMLTRAWG